MGGRRTTVLRIVAAMALVLLGTWFVQHVREGRKAAEREGYYKAVLTKYEGEFKRGMTRVQVEQNLQRDGSRFRQMCCVANFKGEHVSVVGSGWDDLVKIGEESAPWFCSEKNVYIAFEFNPKAPGEQSDTNNSDVLKRISVFHQLEGCL